MNPMQNKTPEERKAIAAKGQATARARREAEESARQDAMTRAEHDAATALPYDEKSLHHPDSGTGWKCYVCNYSGTANNFANRFCANCQCSR